MNTEREAFEAYQNSIGASTSKNKDGKYFSETANAAWMGWQAALANKPNAEPSYLGIRNKDGRLLETFNNDERSRVEELIISLSKLYGDLTLVELYTAPPSTAALQKRIEEFEAVISSKDEALSYVRLDLQSNNVNENTMQVIRDALSLKAGDVQAPKEGNEPKNLGEIFIKLSNGNEKTYKIPEHVGEAIQRDLAIRIEKAIKELHANTPKSCPHAEHFVYCASCVVTPCPLGLAAAPTDTEGK